MFGLVSKETPASRAGRFSLLLGLCSRLHFPHLLIQPSSPLVLPAVLPGHLLALETIWKTHPEFLKDMFAHSLHPPWVCSSPRGAGCAISPSSTNTSWVNVDEEMTASPSCPSPWERRQPSIRVGLAHESCKSPVAVAGDRNVCKGRVSLWAAFTGALQRFHRYLAHPLTHRGSCAGEGSPHTDRRCC